jgi:hypothetical protein
VARLLRAFGRGNRPGIEKTLRPEKACGSLARCGYLTWSFRSYLWFADNPRKSDSTSYREAGSHTFSTPPTKQLSGTRRQWNEFLLCKACRRT